MTFRDYVKEETKDFDKALSAFIKGAMKIIEDDYKLNYPNLKTPELITKSGKKYVKVIQKDRSGAGTSAWAFIDKSTGDLLKPASWAVPAKHARGNIFDQDNGTRSITAYGPAYLKKGRKAK